MSGTYDDYVTVERILVIKGARSGLICGFWMVFF